MLTVLVASMPLTSNSPVLPTLPLVEVLTGTESAIQLKHRRDTRIPHHEFRHTLPLSEFCARQALRPSPIRESNYILLRRLHRKASALMRRRLLFGRDIASSWSPQYHELCARLMCHPQSALDVSRIQSLAVIHSSLHHTHAQGHILPRLVEASILSCLVFSAML
jgi:hypothetical protein